MAGLEMAAAWGCASEPSETRTPTVAFAPTTPAPHQISEDRPEYFRLANTSPGRVPVRVGLILPLSIGSVSTRVLGNSMLKAAELALYDSQNRDIVLMTAEDSGSGSEAASAARTLLAEGAEVIVGPLFSQSVAAVAPLARDKGVPVLAFSTDASVAGDGVYLLSFLPQAEVRRVVRFAASRGHSAFGAMLPATAYGEVVRRARDP